MPKDILFKEEDFVFSYRVGGIAIRNGHILLQKPKNDDFAIIGGHVCRMETSAEALKREFWEELHARIDVDRLMAVGEIFFPWGNRPCHQIGLYYLVHLQGDEFRGDGPICGYDDAGEERTDLEYRWVPLEELKSGLKVYPVELIPYLIAQPDGIVHFISREA